MSIADTFIQNPDLFAFVAALFGLMVGSFLNVVIHRLPIMLENDWRSQCNTFLEIKGQDEVKDESPYNLAVPRSRCPKCNHLITALENIPVISYLFLRGKCRHCGFRISVRYPLVEILTAVLSFFVANHFGYGWQSFGALIFTWALISLSFIDIDKQLLPDNITLPLMWLGLLFSLAGVFVDSHSSIIGAVTGYLVLWSVYWLFKKATGKEGMGYGDFKLLAALGAWLGWQDIPLVIILSSSVGAILGILMILFKYLERNNPIPFGPYLAVAGWVALIWGDQIIQEYSRWMGNPF